MTNNELLLAISDMMDQKLDTRLKPIETDIKSMKEDINTLKEDVSSLKTDVSILKTEVAIIKEDVNSLKINYNTLSTEVSNLKDDVNLLKTDVLSIKLFQENTILPRLNTIESCYTGTYTRSKNYADKMQSAFDDIDLLKKVVSEHSKKLEHLA